ncbi:MAG: type III-A CRISPR-associated RAMP protein Csm5 [Planctomycetales bacterium 4484_123]|nr:MAG: type III-A CRISPR-associated RAMP protein Csm5 [Planctomycetales bacterium 4484_123]
MPTYHLTLTMLSPVHVGTGQELFPDDYVVRASGEDNFTFHAIDVGRLLADLDHRQRGQFNQAADAASITMVRKFIAEHADPARHALWSAPTVKDLFDLHRRSLDRPDLNFSVRPMTRTGLKSRPYIPGSSIKGAIRTAVLQRVIDDHPGLADQLARRYPAVRRDAARMVEADVLGYLHTDRGRERAQLRADPFRAVRLTDACLPANATGMDPVDLVNLDRPAGPGSPGGINMFYEMTFSALDEETVQATGTLSIDDRLARTSARGASRWDFDHCVARDISAGDILQACRDFYRKRLECECRRLADALPNCRDAIHRLRSLAGELAGDEAIIRLGRFSHHECMTLARPLRRVAGGRSRALASGSFPLGWARLQLAPAGR